MVIQPDFLDHYKTKALIARAGESAPMAVICLWVRCHNRRADTFELTPAKLAQICRWSGDADQLFEAIMPFARIKVVPPAFHVSMMRIEQAPRRVALGVGFDQRRHIGGGLLQCIGYPVGLQEDFGSGSDQCPMCLNRWHDI